MLKLIISRGPVSSKCFIYPGEMPGWRTLQRMSQGSRRIRIIQSIIPSTSFRCPVVSRYRLFVSVLQRFHSFRFSISTSHFGDTPYLANGVPNSPEDSFFFKKKVFHLIFLSVACVPPKNGTSFTSCPAVRKNRNFY